VLEVNLLLDRVAAEGTPAQRYASELTRALDPSLLDDPSLEYGFLLHDVGKLGIPDTILQKAGPLTDSERRVMEQHTRLGAEILANVALMQGEGLKVVRSHHERWDGMGYPDGLEGLEIPAGARIFALVDAIDAMTSERPYRRALRWEHAVDEILAQSGRQFDPKVVAAFAARERRMRRICKELAETGSLKGCGLRWATCAPSVPRRPPVRPRGRLNGP
jgi:ribonuclease P protein subunit RPR2